MKQLKYIGKHKPSGMIIEADDEDVNRLIESGEFAFIEKAKPIKIKNGNHRKRSKKRL